MPIRKCPSYRGILYSECPFSVVPLYLYMRCKDNVYVDTYQASVQALSLGNTGLSSR